MSKNILTNPGALLTAVAFGVLMVPACTIHLRQGGEDGSDDTQPEPDDTQPAPDDTQPSPTDGGAGFTPEEQEAIEAARKADPVELALTQAKAGYAAYALSGLTESQIVDPATIDDETLLRLIEENAPLAWEMAEQWVASLDPTTLSYGYPIKVECMAPPFLCNSSVSCDFAKVCILDDCGDGKCKPCPDTWGLGNLITDGWCTYTCYVGNDGDIAGAAITFRPRIGSHIVPWVKLCKAN
ncbi:hypothetical protein [Sorangium cellulosum]|uniref:Uncharacterized protein n=1 Tax=Sorangium cellulosum So0157-2 TaxID=1254432 RepID=S4XMD5_SORCE|nr:hypothetical protein [Sorangium cellulosum]AGP34352.1 hypothetical protein SCE1572_07435 [Sorangium cellulosum So0157-2]